MLLDNLRSDHPSIRFEPGGRFAWHPAQNEIIYLPSLESKQNDPENEWTLLHELGHALLEHEDFRSDVELLHMEADAWQKATEIGKKYQIDIDQDHVQDCLDSYRDWLHSRATCPNCFERCLQDDSTTYRCHNCKTQWQVTKSRLCRAYRRKK